MRILIAEDEAVSRRLLEVGLSKWGYEVIVCADGKHAYDILQEDSAPRLAILDWVMPRMDGIQICSEIRQRVDRPYTYLILLTSKNLKQDVIEGLEAGADDYLVKPFDEHELRARLTTGCRIVDLQDQLISAREALRIQATHDPLTSIWNRTAILDILEKEESRVRREGSGIGVLMADLDHFKTINDSYGHVAGDAVLLEAARRMQSSLRSYDALGRYGGEEFLIVMPGCDLDGTLRSAERLRNCISEKPIFLPEAEISLTISVGVAATDPFHSGSNDNLLRVADTALYRAKNLGRNRVESGTPARIEAVVPS